MWQLGFGVKWPVKSRASSLFPLGPSGPRSRLRLISTCKWASWLHYLGVIWSFFYSCSLTSTEYIYATKIVVLQIYDNKLVTNLWWSINTIGWNNRNALGLIIDDYWECMCVDSLTKSIRSPPQHTPIHPSNCIDYCMGRSIRIIKHMFCRVLFLNLISPCHLHLNI